MAGRAKYSDNDRARVANALAINDGNIKRTARETGVPENTVRDWKRSWEKGGVPATVEEARTVELSRFVEDASRIRDVALRRLEEVIPHSDKVRELATVVGILDDKIARARGIDRNGSDRQIGVHINVTPEQLGSALSSWAEKAASESAQRRADIIEVDSTLVE